MWISTKIDPDAWWIRCRKKTCGAMFNAGEMLRAYKDMQKYTPPGTYFVKCPGCGKEDFLTDPEQLSIGQAILAVKKRRLDS